MSKNKTINNPIVTTIAAIAIIILSFIMLLNKNNEAVIDNNQSQSKKPLNYEKEIELAPYIEQKLNKEAENKNLYYLLKINELNSGWRIVADSQTINNHVISNSKSLTQIMRFGDPSISKSDSIYIEELGTGKFISYEKNSEEKNLVTNTKFSLDPNDPQKGIVTIKKTGFPVEVKHVTIKSEIVGDYKAKLILTKALPTIKKGDIIKLNMYSIELLTEITSSFIFQKTETRKVKGKDCLVYIFDTQLQVGTFVINGLAIFNQDGSAVYEESSFSGIKQSLEQCSAEEIDAPLTTKDALSAFFIKVPKLNDIIRSHATNLTFKVQFPKAKDFEQKLVQDHNISAKTINADKFIYEITTGRHFPSKLMKWPYEGKNNEALENLKATSVLEIKDINLKKFGIKAAGNLTQGEDAYATARQVVNYVRSYIVNKNYEHGYASALETLRNRAGDCTEHSILAVAACRAIGIPARPVFGVAYTRQQVSSGHNENLLIGHQWLEVFINDKWYPLDPAIGMYTLGHIRTGVGNGTDDDLIQTMNGIDLVSGMNIISIEPKTETPKEEK